MTNPSSDSETSPDVTYGARAGVLGSVLMAFGVIVVCLAIADASGGLPFSLPRSWYTNRSLWYLLALASFGTAWNLLRQSAPSTGGEGKPKFGRVVLYTRAGCHLCDEMRQVLDRYRKHLPEIEIVEIDADPKLVEKFTNCVPVLEIDGRVRFRGRINELLLRRLIEAAPARSTVDLSEHPDDADGQLTP
jgi:hypothetical protein